MDQTLTGDAINAVAELARDAAGSIDITAIPHDAVPNDVTIADPHVAIIIGPDGKPEMRSIKAHVDEYRAKPAFRQGTATAGTLASFCTLVNRHASADTAIFVDSNWKAPKFTAVIDYHVGTTQAATEGEAPRRESAPVGEDPLARFGKHRVAYVFPLSDPWKTWVAMNGKSMGQGDFAAFIEDNIADVACPSDMERVEWETKFKTKFADPNTLVDLARGLEVKVGARVKNKFTLQSGETQMVFETEHRDAGGNELIVPGVFLLGIPIFYLGAIVYIPVRLRYRLQDGTVVWFYQLYRPDLFVDERVRCDVDVVERETKLPVYFGAPEAQS